MSDYFYSCADCPEHSVNVKTSLRCEGDVGDYCDLKGRFFSKSWPMRDTPCLAVLEQAEIPCPICDEIMDLYLKGRKFDHFGCKVHGEQTPNGCAQKDGEK